MRIFGGEQIAKVMEMLKIEENQPIEHAMVSKSIESAQVKVEGFFFDQRKNLVEFDDVINRQRDIIYKRRKRLLTQAETDMDPDTDGIQTLHNQIMQYVDSEITNIVSIHAPQGFTQEEYRALIKEFSKMIPFNSDSQEQLVKNISQETDSQVIIDKLQKVAHDTYLAKQKATGEQEIKDLEKIVTLSTLDEKWMEHIDAMDSLRQGIWLRGDKRTVLSEYKKEGFAMFEGLIDSIESTIANKIYRVQFTNRRPVQPRIDLSKAVEQKQDSSDTLAQEVSSSTPNIKSVIKTTTGSTSDLAAVLGKAKTGNKVNTATAKAKIKRNDPCPCGSGKKYKKCGLINSPDHRA